MTLVDTVIAWALPGAGLVFFVLGAWTNASIMFGWSKSVRAARAAGRHVSMVPLVPGVIGAIAMWNGPLEWMQPFFWLPLLLDAGCLPYLVLGLLGPRAQHEVAAREEALKEVGAVIAKTSADTAARSADFYAAFAGCILGTAVGDALGLPYEGLAPRRGARLFPQMDRYHLLPFGRGMCSDDTEHTIMVAQALIQTAGYSNVYRNADEFRATLACAMRLWLLGLPAGIGMATLKGILKLWLFLPSRWQGSYSAGNAPAMRSALIGVFWADEPELLRQHVHAATRLTHSDPKAEHAALAVAIAAAMSARHGGRVDALEYAGRMRALLEGDGAEIAALIDKVARSVQEGESTLTFAQGMGLPAGVTGYALHTAPVALHAWLSHPGSFREAVLAAIACGGDTDTVAAITGAIAGAGAGPKGLPPEWLDNLAEWPHTVPWMEQLAQRLATVRPNYVGTSALATPVSRLIARNIFFLAVVLVHGFRRLLPPY